MWRLFSVPFTVLSLYSFNNKATVVECNNSKNKFRTNNKVPVVECNNSKNKFRANNKATVVECNNSKNKFRATLIVTDILIQVLSYHSLKIIKPASQECFLQWQRV